MANEVVGTVKCWGRGCDEVASVHETKRGGATRKSKLYLNCPECRCLQPTSASSQRYIKQNMDPRSGFEYLAEEKPPQEPKSEPSQEPKKEETETSKEPVNKGALAVLGVFVVGALALLS